MAGDFPDTDVPGDNISTVNGTGPASPTINAPENALSKEVDDVLHSDVNTSDRTLSMISLTRYRSV